MKTVRHSLVIFLFMGLGWSLHLQAQDYKTAIGLRLGSPLSVSFKTFLSEKGAVELFAGYRGYSFYNWIALGGTYQRHIPLTGVEGLNVFFGGGASAFFWSYDAFSEYSSTTFGILGVGGLDYKFKNAPINISADWMPAFFIGTGYTTGFGAGYGALSVRYVLK
jgi:hypothetical protein